jgi:hypothetical protein
MSITTPTLSDEERAAAIERRREERRIKRLNEAIERVAAFRAWIEADAEVTRRRNSGESVPRVSMPPVPTDHDYALVRENEEVQHA